MASKEEAMINFICQCPQIRDNPLFFNFINAKPDNKQFVTVGNEARTHRPFINGSVLKRYTFTLIDFRSATYQPIPKEVVTTTTTTTNNNTGISSQPINNENVEEFIDVQGIIDWLEEQADNRQFPDFGDKCIVDSMKVLTDNPVLNGVDTQIKPALAKYSFTIQVDYIDYTKAIT